MSATKIWRLSSRRFGPAKPGILKCAPFSYAAKPAPGPMPSSSCSPIRASNIWRRVGAPWISPWKNDSTPSRLSVSWKCRPRMPPAITASPHLVTPSRNYCTVPTSSSQRPSPSLVPACPRRKNSSQNGLCSKFSPLTGFWRFVLGGEDGLQGTAWIYWNDVPLTGVEIYLRDFEGIYAFPSSGGTVVGAHWSIDRFRAIRRDIDTSYMALLCRVAPQLAECVMHASRADERLYLGSTRNFFRTTHGPGWVLLGDAHYKKDPCTAQGITDAFCDAERLADAIDQGLAGRRPLSEALAEYARQSVEWALPFYEFTCQMATFAPPAPDMRALYTALQGNQEAIDRFIGLITEATSPADFFAPEHVQRLLARPTAQTY